MAVTRSKQRAGRSRAKTSPARTSAFQAAPVQARGLEGVLLLFDQHALPARPLEGQGQSYAAGARAEVGKAGLVRQVAFQGRLHHELRLRPRDEHAREDGKVPAVELAKACDVGHGLALEAPGEQGFSLGFGRRSQILCAVDKDAGGIEARRQAKQDPGLQAGRIPPRFAKPARGSGKPGIDAQASPYALPASASGAGSAEAFLPDAFLAGAFALAVLPAAVFLAGAFALAPGSSWKARR